MLPFTIIAAAIAVTVLMTALSPPPEKKVEPDKAMAVDAMTVKKQDVTITVPSQGRVTPRVHTLLTSEISGSVIEVSGHFVDGGFVRKGQLLLKFDDRNYRAAVKKAEADVARANKLLIQEKGQAQVAYSQWRKSKQIKRSQEALSLLLHKPQLKEAEANLEFAKAELLRVKGDLEKTVIRAPFDGLIKKKFIDIAQYAGPGTNLAELVAVDYAEVRLAIPQDRIAYMDLPGIATDKNAYSLDDATQSDEGTTAEQSTSSSAAPGNRKTVPVLLKSYYGDTEYQWHAEIVRTEGLFDDKNHTLYAVARVEDPYLLKAHSDGQPENRVPLLMGTYVEAFIQGHEMKDMVRIPRHVLRAGNNVWVIDGNNQLRNRKLDVLRIGGDELYVRSGLKNGERICLTHVGEVVPGTPVRIADAQDKQKQTAMLYE